MKRPLKMQAMYPKVNEGFLFDAPEGVVFGKTEIGTISRQTKYLCKPMEGVRYTDGHALVIGGERFREELGHPYPDPVIRVAYRAVLY